MLNFLGKNLFCARVRKNFCALHARAQLENQCAREKKLARYARARKIFCAHHPSENPSFSLIINFRSREEI